jgi:hypothetical protein
MLLLVLKHSRHTAMVHALPRFKLCLHGMQRRNRKPSFNMSFLDRTTVKRLFRIPRNVRLSDEEFHDRRGFVQGVMCSSGSECKCWVQDFVPFQHEFKPNWALLFDRFCAKLATGVKEWPEVGAKDTLCFFHDDNGKDVEVVVPLVDWQIGATASQGTK